MNLKQNKYLNFKMPVKLHKWAKENAFASGMSLASYIRFLIIKDQKKETK